MPAPSTAPAGRSSSIAGFTRLSPAVYLFDPSTSTDASTSPASTHSPSTIILCTWMGASLRNVAKYTAHYQRLYPHVQIMIVTCSVADMIYRPLSTQTAHLEPAISALRRTCSRTAAGTFRRRCWKHTKQQQQQKVVRGKRCCRCVQ